MARAGTVNAPRGAKARRVRAVGYCPEDLNGDDEVDAADLSIMLGYWGIPDPPVGDLDGDGDVDAADLAELLANWGKCP